MIVISIILGYMSATLSEYMLHRYYLHRSKDEDHIKVHHIQFNSHINFSSPEIRYQDVASSVGYILGTVALTFPIGLLLMLFSPFYTLEFLVVGLLYAFGLEVLHVYYHQGKVNVMTKMTWFKKLCLHHYLHHKYYTLNYGIGSRVWDRLFGTTSTEE